MAPMAMTAMRTRLEVSKPPPPKRSPMLSPAPVTRSVRPLRGMDRKGTVKVRPSWKIKEGSFEEGEMATARDHRPERSPITTTRTEELQECASMFVFLRVPDLNVLRGGRGYTEVLAGHGLGGVGHVVDEVRLGGAVGAAAEGGVTGEAEGALVGGVGGGSGGGD